jgi:hypothetical protein
VLAYLNKQAQIRSQLRTRSKQEIEAQLASYLTFFIWAQLPSYLLLMLVCPLGAKGLASK